jgi:hypothetical protein
VEKNCWSVQPIVRRFIIEISVSLSIRGIGHFDMECETVKLDSAMMPGELSHLDPVHIKSIESMNVK